MSDTHLAILFGIAILCGYGIRYMSSFSAKEYGEMCDRWRKLHDLSMASLREASKETVLLEKNRDEWNDIAERCIEYVYDQDWDTYACDIIKDYEKLAKARIQYTANEY